MVRELPSGGYGVEGVPMTFMTREAAEQYVAAQRFTKAHKEARVVETTGTGRSVTQVSEKEVYSKKGTQEDYLAGFAAATGEAEGDVQVQTLKEAEAYTTQHGMEVRKEYDPRTRITTHTRTKPTIITPSGEVIKEGKVSVVTDYPSKEYAKGYKEGKAFTEGATLQASAFASAIKSYEAVKQRDFSRVTREDAWRGIGLLWTPAMLAMGYELGLAATTDKAAYEYKTRARVKVEVRKGRERLVLDYPEEQVIRTTEPLQLDDGIGQTVSVSKRFGLSTEGLMVTEEPQLLEWGYEAEYPSKPSLKWQVFGGEEGAPGVIGKVEVFADTPMDEVTGKMWLPKEEKRTDLINYLAESYEKEMGVTIGKEPLTPSNAKTMVKDLVDDTLSGLKLKLEPTPRTVLKPVKLGVLTGVGARREEVKSVKDLVTRKVSGARVDRNVLQVVKLSAKQVTFPGVKAKPLILPSQKLGFSQKEMQKLGFTASQKQVGAIETLAKQRATARVTKGLKLEFPTAKLDLGLPGIKFRDYKIPLEKKKRKKIGFPTGKYAPDIYSLLLGKTAKKKAKTKKFTGLELRPVIKKKKRKVKKR